MVYMRNRYKLDRKNICQPEDDSIRYIALSKGKHTIVDAEIYEELNKYHWYAYKHPQKYSYYAVREVRDENGYVSILKMHNVILKPREGFTVDHKDYLQTLDNRTENLRYATASQQMANRGKFRNSTSPYKGITLRPECNLWRARIVINGKRVGLGHYKTAEEAHAAYSKAAIAHFGEFARVA